MKELTDFIWKNKKEIDLDMVQRSSEYTKCCNYFAKWKFVVEEAVKDMLFDLKNLDTAPSYVIFGDKICYKE